MTAQNGQFEVQFIAVSDSALAQVEAFPGEVLDELLWLQGMLGFAESDLWPELDPPSEEEPHPLVPTDTTQATGLNGVVGFEFAPSAYIGAFSADWLSGWGVIRP